jgi:hypothetical protein
VRSRSGQRPASARSTLPTPDPACSYGLRLWSQAWSEVNCPVNVALTTDGMGLHVHSNASNPGIHREDRVIYAAVPCNEGGFSPRVFTLVGSIRSANRRAERTILVTFLGHTRGGLPGSAGATPAAGMEGPFAAAISSKLPRFYRRFCLHRTPFASQDCGPLLARFLVCSQAPDSHFRTPVEMNVLLSQPKSSQSGMVDATS